ncbi:MAG: DUF2271 domain-containing protein [Alphaproteobacteria bacterium]|nr:DUF2271 domain-containing protein [Alphaproteobacteria bacterium]
MNKLAKILLISTAIWLPQIAEARNVTFDLTVKSYTGPGAYVVVYITRPDNQLHSTIWLNSKEEKYLPALMGWHRHALRQGVRVDGFSGASLGAGKSAKFSVNIPESLIDTGYKIQVDAAAEDQGIAAKDINIPLTSANANTTGKRGFITAFSMKM